MTTYYRVNLQEGIKPEEQKVGFYSGNEELGKTVFKSLRAAKQSFNKITKAEIDRLRDLRRNIGPVVTREQLIEIQQAGTE